MANAVVTLRRKAYEYVYEAERQEGLQQQVAADQLRLLAIALTEVALALDEEDEAA